MYCLVKYWINFYVVVVVLLFTARCQITTDVLWESCDTTICGQVNLNIQCETNSKILINNVTSGLGRAFDAISYLNLRRMCMGMSSCNPRQTGFCKNHRGAAQFNVSYTCVKEKTIDNSCDSEGRVLPNKSGFITSPNYPAETKMRRCKWKIVVPARHYVHVFLHEVVPNSPEKCEGGGEGGLRFSTNNNCGNRFPTFPVCSESSMNSTISACNTTEVWLPWSSQNMRFWLSYYVVEVPELHHVSIYTVDITCTVLAKDKFTYHIPDEINNKTGTPSINATNGTDITGHAARSEDEDSVDYVMYIGLAVGIVVIVVIVVIATIYLRCRCLSAMEQRDSSKSNMSNSNSQTNCSEIQKRPLPEAHETTDLDALDQAVLQQGYSMVADEIPRQRTQPSLLSPTYAEIEEYSETGMKPKVPLVSKRSVDNSKRKLPAKPDEAQNSIYSEIEDANDKDTETEKSILTSEKSIISKNKKNQEKIYPKYNYKKKLSNASNIYDECQDVSKVEHDKTYIDMSHKTADESDYVPHTKNSKTSKDKANQSKKSRVTDRWLHRNTGILYADCEDKKKGPRTEVVSGVNKSKKESVTSDSDSDEDICIVENELYEPFESAKV